ncbi:uncharacterized protein RHOBADRAFT_44476 [Rhodotorula graminis WP1]|uniref:Uncharacterized protein n=1 Tax=Rhodotorula graminis (strain WP1) TaxID=578459 RepID=A0A194S359_RHOGW|nr:uncharacterized protein RHOBADRAFT_44476 [Rhodotorula graminis WP1]KPV74959.1 hypothetical protein RHOBADRAFT_44476 [Rhodotorula graminis WP1]
MVWRNPSQATLNRGPEPDASRPADLERSNTGTSISTFFFGKATRHTVGRRPDGDRTAPAPLLPYLASRSNASPTLPLRASKLLQVEKLPRDERIVAWQAGRDDELGGLERWRAQVARDVRWEEDEAKSKGEDVSAVVSDFQSMLETSLFSTSFAVGSLKLPPSPLQPDSPVEHLDPLHRDSMTLPPDVHADDEIERDENGFPFPPPRDASLAADQPRTIVRNEIDLVPPTAYRFPTSAVPPTPPFPSLVRVETAPPSPISPHEHVSPPPRSSSLPFHDLLRVYPCPSPSLSTPSPSSLAPSPSHTLPPHCGLVPPKAAALLGLFDPSAPLLRHGATASRARNDSGDAGRATAAESAGYRDSLDLTDAGTTSSALVAPSYGTGLSLGTGPGGGYRSAAVGVAHAHAHGSSLSSLAYSAPTSYGGGGTGGGDGARRPKLSLDMTRGAPRLVASPSTPAARSGSGKGLVLHRAGMSSLPELHHPPSSSMSSSSRDPHAHRSIHPAPAAPWATWEAVEHGDELEELDLDSSASSCDAESAVDGFNFGALAHRVVGARRRRKSSFK